MILEGNSRANGAELARHLLNPRDNDHVTVHAVDGFIADDLFGAFAEVEAVSQATQCQKYLFSLSLNPPPNEVVEVEVFEKTIATVERQLGLVGQPRTIVFHEKLGRRHAHCVWSRINADQMKAIKLSHYKHKLMDVSRDLYRLHDWKMPDGIRKYGDRDPLNFSRSEAAQAKRTQQDPKRLKDMFQRCWQRSDSKSSFASALWAEGFLLARGERRGFVAVDANGKVWSLSRWCGVKPKLLRARLGLEDTLWSAEEARHAFQDLQAQPSPGTEKQSDKDTTAQRDALVERQRRERTTLNSQQELHRIEGNKARRSRLPTGLKAAWMKVTSQYQALQKHLASEADAAAIHDRQEVQVLINRHLNERRELDRSLSQDAIAAELSKLFDGAVNPDHRQRLILPADDLPFTKEELIARPELIVGYISHKNDSFTRTDVLRELAKRISDPLVLKGAADKAMTSVDLIILGETDPTKYTTKDYQRTLSALHGHIHDLANRKGPKVQDQHIAAAMCAQDAAMQSKFGGALSNEQRTALRHILGANQLASVVGLAGAGKSTLLATANDAWTRQGIKVHGAALAGKAADGLQQSSGIASRTLASLEASWKNGYEPIGPNDVLVVDEAGMVGTRQMMRIAQKVNEIGAKLILVGDPDQLQPIEAGNPFRDLVETQGAARLTEIHRQKDEWQKHASRDLAEGNIVQAIQAYGTHGAVQQRWNRDTALAALVEDYMSDLELNGSDISRLAFAHRRRDVHALNQAIRSAIRSSNDLSQETMFETETGPRAFVPGDRIVFTRNDKNIGVKNGMLGTVRTISDDLISVTLDGGDGAPQEIRFNPRMFHAFDHGYAVTIHKSQGATVDHSYVLASRTMDNPLTYVAMTRHRLGLNLYLNEEDQPKWNRYREPSPTRTSAFPTRLR